MIGYGPAAPDMPVWLHRLWPMLWWPASAVAVVAFVDYAHLGNRFTVECNAVSARK